MRTPKLLVAEELLKETRQKVNELNIEATLKGQLGQRKLNQALREILDDLCKITVVLEKIDLFQIIKEHENKINFLEVKLENIQNYINHNSIGNK